jgi:hypothetical protein
VQLEGRQLSFERVISHLREAAANIPDIRTGANCHYSIQDVALGAFSVFFTQSPSFLEFQRRMKQHRSQHNAATLFGVEEIPSDNHIRSLLDGVPADRFYAVFDAVFEQLNAAGELERFRSVGGDLLLTIDGTEYHRSEKIHCEHCRVSTHTNGTVSYSHALLTPALVAPHRGEVIALSPEFIRRGDGNKKTEGELTAAKRWLSRVGERLSPHSVTVVGDDLYATQSFLTAVREAEVNFLAVCKPQSHKYLAEYIESLRANGDLDRSEHTEWDGREHRRVVYEWSELVPIRATADAMEVGWFSVEITGEDGRRIYRNSFITNHPVTAETVAQLVAAARARWKVENEDINTLKTKGYNLEHNFGHGAEHLAETLATLMILAFVLHTVLDLFDARYRLLRSHIGRRSRFFSELATLLKYLFFPGWQPLLQFMIEHLELPDPGG